MTLTRRMALFIAGMLLLALGGALVIHTLAARDALQAQQDMHNRDAAATLALALSQQQADAAAMEAVARAQFDLGHYRHIRLVSPAGRVLLDMQQDAPPARSPAWFGHVLPMTAADGSALVNAGWRELGTLSVAAHTAWAQDALWDASLRSAALLAGLAALAAVLTAWMLRAWQRPLQATVEQAQALARGQFVEAPLPSLPELQALTSSMNTTVQRLRETFSGQAEQVAYLQRQAQLDNVTGLALLEPFSDALGRRLAHQDGVSLLLVRVRALDVLNERHGRAVADQVLRRAGEVLAAYSRAEPDSLAGRLGGPDLALLLPVPGLAADLARPLQNALRDALSPLGTGAQVAVAAHEGLLASSAEAALATALKALAQAEAEGGLHVVQPGLAGWALADLPAWQSQITVALQEQRAQLGEYPVQDPQGRLIHLECPLRLQLDPHGAFQPAAKWLPVARRCGLLPQVDATAIALALQAITRDGRPRAVNVELSSLAAPGFAADVARRLADQPQAAQRLWVEWVAAAPQGNWQAALDAAALWQPYGVHIGVEHAGGAPEHLAALRDMHLDYVKVDARHLRGAAANPRVQAYARSLAGLVKLLGLKVLAEGVESAADLVVLWQLGYDGATGKALRLGGGIDVAGLTSANSPGATSSEDAHPTVV